MAFVEQLSQADVEGSFDVAEGQAVVRPLSTALHVTDDCNRTEQGLVSMCGA